MNDIFNSETFWLNATNAVLGLVTLICLAVVGRVAVKEIYARVANRGRIPIEQDSHAFNFADLGITMADGGERIDEANRAALLHPEEISDPGNIVRSNN